jgi:hypothetical protein
MSDPGGSRAGDRQSTEELDQRIAAVRENIRQLIEQAAADSGAADDELASERIGQQQELLDTLIRERGEVTGGSR